MIGTKCAVGVFKHLGSPAGQMQARNTKDSQIDFFSDAEFAATCLLSDFQPNSFDPPTTRSELNSDILWRVDSCQTQCEEISQ